MKKVHIACIAAVSLVCAGCSAKKDWNRARAQDTVLAYEMFLDAHPNSDESVLARHRIEALQDAGAWSRAQRNGTIGGYAEYLRWRPDGAHAAQARSRMYELERKAGEELRRDQRP
jgi:hypothetical protein